MRSPLTGVVFTLELTHAWSYLLPLVLAAISAYALSVLLLKRSVLTEKIARRQLHLTRELAEAYVTKASVVDRHEPARLVGVITLAQLLHARRRDLHEEHHRERLLP